MVTSKAARLRPDCRGVAVGRRPSAGGRGRAGRGSVRFGVEQKRRIWTHIDMQLMWVHGMNV
eukprot:7815267-Lingulodinium_polyedra.AAC.1